MVARCLVLCGALWALLHSPVHAQPLDVLHYHIALDVQLKQQTLAGHTRVLLRSQVRELRILDLSLMQMTVKQVSRQGQRQRFEQHGDRLFIELLQPVADGDTCSLDIHYLGKPAAPSWFGGFYMTDSSAFNLGVWIDGTPPNFGKAWFPCVDNFTDKATYSYAITTPKAYTAVCGGVLERTVPLGKDRTTHHWRLDKPIATYLASVAVGRYTAVEMPLRSISGQVVPAMVYVHPQDATDAATHFRGLQEVFAAFEAHFGAYAWPRVGYVSVAMKGGAMEHAVNIAYPTSGLRDPGISLWVHELAHSWFGNLVTCKDAGEMWLNEGFARYCETLGQYAYLRQRDPQADPRLLLARLQDEDIHGPVLSRTHVQDGDWLAVSGVPPQLTYGSTVYDKGATVVHALRGFLGDSLFFGGLRAYLQQHAWGNAGSDDLQRALTAYSQLDLSDFFDTWVYQPGFVHYRLVDTLREGGRLRVVLAQTSWMKPRLATHSRIPLWLLGPQGQQTLQVVDMVGAQDTLWLTPPHPVADVWLDPFNQVPDARTGTTVRLTGQYLRKRKELAGHLDVRVAAGDTAWVRLQRHWGTAPEVPGAGHLCWWTVDTHGPVQGTLHLRYDKADRGREVPSTARPKLYHKAGLRAPWLHVVDIPFGRTEHTLELPVRPGYYAIGYE